MPDTKGNLYLFEAIELRKEYDRHIKLIEELLGEGNSKRDRLFSRSDDEEREPASDFSREEIDRNLKKLQTKRVKLNQAIQKANFEYKVNYRGEEISVAEALEIRKNLISDIQAISERVKDSAYKTIIHKEERDIIKEPRRLFQDTYLEYQDSLKELRRLVNQIHIVNHEKTVDFKDE